MKKKKKKKKKKLKNMIKKTGKKMLRCVNEGVRDEQAIVSP